MASDVSLSASMKSDHQILSWDCQTSRLNLAIHNTHTDLSTRMRFRAVREDSSICNRPWILVAAC
jgi:hypothetical protein